MISPIVKAVPVGTKAINAIMAVSSAGAVGIYVRSQLRTQSRTFDRYFSQQNTTKSEAVRAKAFEGTVADPRTSLFNILGW